MNSHLFLKKPRSVIIIFAILALCIYLTTSLPKAKNNEPIPSPSPTPETWQSYTNPILGITLNHPSSYVPDKITTGETLSIGIENKPINVQEISLQAGEGESASIQIVSTKDQHIIDYATTDATVKNVRFANISWQQATIQGLGDPISYFTKTDGRYLVITFTFPPDQTTINKIMNSVKISPPKPLDNN